MIDDKKESQMSQNHQSIAFEKEVDPSPLLTSRLKAALTNGNAWTVSKDSTAKKVWVEGKAKELYEAFEKRRKAESSTCGYSESADRWSVKEGTTQDLQYTLVRILVQPCNTVKANHSSRHKYMRSTVQL